MGGDFTFSKDDKQLKIESSDGEFLYTFTDKKQDYNNKKQYCVKNKQNEMVFASKHRLGIIYWLIHSLKSYYPNEEIQINFNNYKYARQKINFKNNEIKKYKESDIKGKRVITDSYIPSGVTVIAYGENPTNNEKITGNGSLDYLFVDQKEDKVKYSSNSAVTDFDKFHDKKFEEFISSNINNELALEKLLKTPIYKTMTGELSKIESKDNIISTKLRLLEIYCLSNDLNKNKEFNTSNLKLQCKQNDLKKYSEVIKQNKSIDIANEYQIFNKLNYPISDNDQKGYIVNIDAKYNSCLISNIAFLDNYMKIILSKYYSAFVFKDKVALFNPFKMKFEQTVDQQGCNNLHKAYAVSHLLCSKHFEKKVGIFDKKKSGQIKIHCGTNCELFNNFLKEDSSKFLPDNLIIEVKGSDNTTPIKGTSEIDYCYLEYTEENTSFDFSRLLKTKKNFSDLPGLIKNQKITNYFNSSIETSLDSFFKNPVIKTIQSSQTLEATLRIQLSLRLQMVLLQQAYEQGNKKESFKIEIPDLNNQKLSNDLIKFLQKNENLQLIPSSIEIEYKKNTYKGKGIGIDIKQMQININNLVGNVRKYGEKSSKKDSIINDYFFGKNWQEINEKNFDPTTLDSHYLLTPTSATHFTRTDLDMTGYKDLDKSYCSYILKLIQENKKHKYNSQLDSTINQTNVNIDDSLLNSSFNLNAQSDSNEHKTKLINELNKFSNIINSYIDDNSIDNDKHKDYRDTFKHRLGINTDKHKVSQYKNDKSKLSVDSRYCKEIDNEIDEAVTQYRLERVLYNNYKSKIINEQNLHRNIVELQLLGQISNINLNDKLKRKLSDFVLSNHNINYLSLSNSIKSYIDSNNKFNEFLISIIERTEESNLTQALDNCFSIKDYLEDIIKYGKIKNNLVQILGDEKFSSTLVKPILLDLEQTNKLKELNDDEIVKKYNQLLISTLQIDNHTLINKLLILKNSINFEKFDKLVKYYLSKNQKNKISKTNIDNLPEKDLLVLLDEDQAEFFIDCICDTQVTEKNKENLEALANSLLYTKQIKGKSEYKINAQDIQLIINATIFQIENIDDNSKNFNNIKERYTKMHIALAVDYDGCIGHKVDLKQEKEQTYRNIQKLLAKYQGFKGKIDYYNFSLRQTKSLDQLNAKNNGNGEYIPKVNSYLSEYNEANKELNINLQTYLFADAYLNKKSGTYYDSVVDVGHFRSTQLSGDEDISKAILENKLNLTFGIAQELAASDPNKLHMLNLHDDKYDDEKKNPILRTNFEFYKANAALIPRNVILVFKKTVDGYIKDHEQIHVKGSGIINYNFKAVFKDFFDQYKKASENVKNKQVDHTDYAQTITDLTINNIDSSIDKNYLDENITKTILELKKDNNNEKIDQFYNHLIKHHIFHIIDTNEDLSGIYEKYYQDYPGFIKDINNNIDAALLSKSLTLGEKTYKAASFKIEKDEATKILEGYKQSKNTSLVNFCNESYKIEIGNDVSKTEDSSLQQPGKLLSEFITVPSNLRDISLWLKIRNIDKDDIQKLVKLCPEFIEEYLILIQKDNLDDSTLSNYIQKIVTMEGVFKKVTDAKNLAKFVDFYLKNGIDLSSDLIKDFKGNQNQINLLNSLEQFNFSTVDTKNKKDFLANTESINIILSSLNNIKVLDKLAQHYNDIYDIKTVIQCVKNKNIKIADNFDFSDEVNIRNPLLKLSNLLNELKNAESIQFDESEVTKLLSDYQKDKVSRLEKFEFLKKDNDSQAAKSNLINKQQLLIILELVGRFKDCPDSILVQKIANGIISISDSKTLDNIKNSLNSNNDQSELLNAVKLAATNLDELNAEALGNINSNPKLSNILLKNLILKTVNDFNDIYNCANEVTEHRRFCEHLVNLTKYFNTSVNDEDIKSIALKLTNNKINLESYNLSQLGKMDLKQFETIVAFRDKKESIVAEIKAWENAEKGEEYKKIINETNNSNDYDKDSDQTLYMQIRTKLLLGKINSEVLNKFYKFTTETKNDIFDSVKKLSATDQSLKREQITCLINAIFNNELDSSNLIQDWSKVCENNSSQDSDFWSYATTESTNNINFSELFDSYNNKIKTLYLVSDALKINSKNPKRYDDKLANNKHIANSNQKKTKNKFSINDFSFHNNDELKKKLQSIFKVAASRSSGCGSTQGLKDLVRIYNNSETFQTSKSLSLKSILDKFINDKKESLQLRQRDFRWLAVNDDWSNFHNERKKLDNKFLFFSSEMHEKLERDFSKHGENNVLAKVSSTSTL
ncbi:MAG: hypothetical protein EP298_00100 [Gammaproteobacteria bacterium]|nr:MAG: hypothetical protein EP298_00100 [Gammaproteobacteria bacterium]UTW41594.1 hypothetical protein KFE69_08745 [bacterium SCSIO 12844]